MRSVMETMGVLSREDMMMLSVGWVGSDVNGIGDDLLSDEGELDTGDGVVVFKRTRLAGGHPPTSSSELGDEASIAQRLTKSDS